MNPRAPHRFRPELEVLEARLVPQATRTWVSGVGDDANPASRTAPAKTFAGAISKTAAGGEIDVLDPGGFGAVTITKSITIDSEGNIAGVLVSGTNGIVVNAAATDVVVLRGLDFNGLNTGLAGIKIISAAAVFVENCTIQEFQQGIDFEPTTNCQLFVSNTIVRNNDPSSIDPTGANANDAGIFVNPASGFTATVTVDQSRLENNRVGLEANGNSMVTVNNGVAAGNTIGNFLATGGATITVLPTPAAPPPALPPTNQANTPLLGVVAAGKDSLFLVGIGGTAGPATGLVLFLDGNQIFGISGLVNGQANLRVGRSRHTRHVQVVYLGDPTYGASVSFVLVIPANHVV
jgi:hypothetical protein